MRYMGEMEVAVAMVGMVGLEQMGMIVVTMVWRKMELRRGG